MKPQTISREAYNYRFGYSRDLKFRYVHYDDNGVPEMYYILHTEFDDAYHDQWNNLMLGIFLTDSDGVDIYEGDFVLLTGYSSGLDKEICEVRFVENIILEAQDQYSLYSAAECDTMKIKVIGNIYEEPQTPYTPEGWRRIYDSLGYLKDNPVVRDFLETNQHNINHET